METWDTDERLTQQEWDICLVRVKMRTLKDLLRWWLCDSLWWTIISVLPIYNDELTITSVLPIYNDGWTITSVLPIYNDRWTITSVLPYIY